jgi:hypothetical protein
VLHDGPDHRNNDLMGSGCNTSDRVVQKVVGVMGTALESAGSVQMQLQEVYKTWEYSPSDGLFPTIGTRGMGRMLGVRW